MEGDEFDFCELKGTKFQLGKPQYSNRSFFSVVIKVQVRDVSISSVFIIIMSMPAFIKPKTIFPASLE